MPYRLIDGNDVVAVADASRELVAAVRAGDGPQFLEAVTYRWRGHVGPKEDLDVGVRRRPEDLTAWKRRDPVARLIRGMREAGMVDDASLAMLRDEVEARVEAAVAAAEAAPYPVEDALLDRVYIAENGS